jgi:regulator of chromosome condensation
MPPKKLAKKAELSTPTSTSKAGKRGRPASSSSSTPLNTAPTQRLDIYVFGSGEYGELGLGAEKRNGKKPKDVRRPRLNDLLDARTVGVVQIAVGGMHCIALTHDNQIITWGVNDNGALGRDTMWEAPERDISDEDSEEDDDDSGLNPKESTPTAISAGSFDTGAVFVQVAATDSASFALTEEGSVYSWGTFRVSFSQPLHISIIHTNASREPTES